jgi:hypothetical protein
MYRFRAISRPILKPRTAVAKTMARKGWGNSSLRTLGSIGEKTRLYSTEMRFTESWYLLQRFAS